MLLEKSGEITPERMKRWSQSKNNIQFWMWLVMEVKSDAVKNNIATGTWNVRYIGSVQFSRSVVSDSLWPHELQHARPPYPSPIPEVYLNSCPCNRWCHPTISSSVSPFSFCSQTFPASVSLPMSQLFASGGKSIGVSTSTSVLSMNNQDWSPLGWTG